MPPYNPGFGSAPPQPNLSFQVSLLKQLSTKNQRLRNILFYVSKNKYDNFLF